MKNFLKPTISTFIITLFIFFNGQLANGQTYVSGNITVNTTWTKLNSPYIVTGTVQVYPDVTLTIEPGVVINFESDAGLKIGGILIARGMTNDKITFTGVSLNKIEFVSGTPITHFDTSGNYLNGSIFERCNMESVYIDSKTNVFLTNCSFKASWIYLTDVPGGILVFVTENQIYDSSVELKLGAYYSKMWFTKNDIQLSTIRLITGSVEPQGLAVSNNLAINSSMYAYTYNHAEANIENNVIRLGDGRFDIALHVWCLNSKANIINNIITKNQAIGLDFEGNHLNLHKNLIIYNRKYIDGRGGIYLHKAPTWTSIFDFSGNDIYGNEPFDVYNATDKQIEVSNNWWGTTDIPTIESKIYDYYDDFTQILHKKVEK